MILAELLLASGSLYKPGNDNGRKHHQSLDDVYGWSVEDTGKANENSRIGLPALRNKKQTK